MKRITVIQELKEKREREKRRNVIWELVENTSNEEKWLKSLVT